MYQYHCLNPIAEVGLKNFNGNYAKTDKIEDADAVLVRSAVMHDMDLPEKLCLVNSFNLHFRADGTVETLYTFVKGFDENGNFVDSYLIS